MMDDKVCGDVVDKCAMLRSALERDGSRRDRISTTKRSALDLLAHEGWLWQAIALVARLMGLEESDEHWRTRVRRGLAEEAAALFEARYRHKHGRAPGKLTVAKIYGKELDDFAVEFGFRAREEWDEEPDRRTTVTTLRAKGSYKRRVADLQRTIEWGDIEP